MKNNKYTIYLFYSVIFLICYALTGCPAPGNSTADPKISTNASLSNLIINPGILNFKSDLLNYDITYASVVTTITITPTAADKNYDKIQLTINPTDGGNVVKDLVSGQPSEAIDLLLGANIIEITVTAQDKITTKTYTLSITNTTDKTNALTALSVNGTGIPGFSPEIKIYNIELPYTPTVNITATAVNLLYKLQLELNDGGTWLDISSGVTTSELPLNVGLNKIRVKLTPLNKQTGYYYIIYIKNVGHSNANLASLAVSQGTLNFQSDTTSYTLKYPSVTSSITITATAEDAQYTALQLTLNGSSTYIPLTSGEPSSSLSLEEGINTVEIKCIAQDNTQKVYTLKILNGGSSNANLLILAANTGTFYPDFSSSITTYSVNVVKAVAALTIRPVTADPNYFKLEYTSDGISWTAISSGNTSAPIALTTTPMLLLVKVTAENGTTEQTYTLVINKIDESIWVEKIVPGQIMPQVWSAVTSSADGTKLAATVSGGSIYTSVDSGVNWTKQSNTIDANWCTIVSSADGNKLAAAIRNGTIYTSGDAGVTWVNQQTGAGGTRLWYALASSSDGQKLAAVVSGSYIFYSNDYGVNWAPYMNTTPGSRSWRAIASSTDGNKLAAAPNNQVIYTTTDRTTWYTQTSSGSRYWTTIASSADGSTLVAGVGGTTTPGSLFISTNSGLTWSEQTSIGSYNWAGVTASTDGTKLAAVATGGPIYTLTTNNGGTSWTATARESNRNWRAIAGSSDGSKLVAVVESGYIYTSSNSGANWTERIIKSPRNWSGITTAGNTNLLAGVATDGYIYISNDGNTWQEQTGAGKRLWQAITASADGMKQAAVVAGGSIYISTNGGSSWTASTAGNLNWKAIASSADGNKLAAVVNGGYIWTSTGGTTWIQQNNDTSRNWQAIASNKDGSRLAAIVQLDSSVYMSTNSGVNWTPRNITGATQVEWTSIATSADGLKLAATINNENIYISMDGGNFWQIQPQSGKRPWRSISMSANGGLIAAVADNDYIYTSSDQGVTWQAQQGLGKRAWRSVTVRADGALLAAVAANEVNVFTCY